MSFFVRLVGFVMNTFYFSPLLKTIFERLFLRINSEFSDAVRCASLACGFICLSVAFDFEHSIKNYAVSGLRLRVQ